MTTRAQAKFPYDGHCFLEYGVDPGLSALLVEKNALCLIGRPAADADRTDQFPIDNNRKAAD